MRKSSVSIYRRANAKNGLYYLKFREPKTGRDVRQSTGTRVRREAERVALKLEKELEQGTHNSQGSMPWDEFRERYSRDVLSSLADKTEDKVDGVFNVLEDLVNPQRLSDLNEDSLSEYQRTLRDMGRAESTIKGHLAHILAALNWAVSQKWLATVPAVKMPKRAQANRVAKGRPLTLEEFERLLLKTESIVAQGVADHRREEIVESWQFTLWGLWHSGLRLAEAMELHWTDESKLCPIDLDTTRPLLSIPRDLEKANRDRELPMAPEFARFLQAVPQRQRIGYVFTPLARRNRYGERLTAHHVGRTISDIGKAANVVVSEKGGKRKYASAHDLRRSFGQRWSQLILPQQLRELMRHESIETTMRYYVRVNAKATADVLWIKFEAREEPEAGLGNTFGNSGKPSIK